jgi:hypothetical protein
MRRVLAVALGAVAVVGAVSFAGDPVPDVDVTVEQKPCPCAFFIEVQNGAPFDRLTLGGARGFLGELQPERLPAGWVMTREGRRVVLSGPAVSRPTRIALRTGRTIDKTVDWDVSIAGRELASRKGVVPRSVPPRGVSHSLEGVVVLPEKVSPGEAVALRPLPGADLPPGRFILSGVVMEPLSEDDLASGMAIVNTTRSNIRKDMPPLPPASPKPVLPLDAFVLEGPAGVACAELLPLAAVLLGAGSTGECASCKSFYESRSNTANRAPGEAVPVGESTPGATAKSFYESRSNTANRAPKARVGDAGAVGGGAPEASPSWDVQEVHPRSATAGEASPAAIRGGHESAKNAIRNMKGFYSVAPAAGGGNDSAAFTIDQKGGKRWEVTPSGGAPFRMQVQQRPLARPVAWVALEITPTPAGCLVMPREPDLADVVDLVAAMQAQKPRPDRPEGKPDRDPVQAEAAEVSHAPRAVARLPEELLPGTAISLQYIDTFGDVVVDVPAVEGTEVVPPKAETEPPCVTAATAYAQAGDTVCVCGHFPGAAAQAGIWIDERDAGAPVASSSRTMQFELPGHALTPGRHVWSGNPEAGYVPTCRAWTQVLQIGGSIDSQRLFSSQSTPMRLTVSGTTDKVPLRIRNLTPGIVNIDGGADQTAESSGGSPNTVTRSVQGLLRGDFKIEWSLATDRCPCS